MIFPLLFISVWANILPHLHAKTQPSGQNICNRKLALIIAIGKYQNTFDTLSVDRDADKMREAFLLQGFSQVHTLSHWDCTQEGIRKAVADLSASVNEGDVVWLHYSGHGTRLPDTNGDEADGLDEALVPIDAQIDNPTTFLLDDEVAVWIDRLRRRAGKYGDVVFSFDACYSGSLNRVGSTDAQQERGIGNQPPLVGAYIEGSGFEEIAAALPSDQLSPYLVMSATRSDLRALQVKDETGEYMGPLSLALSRELAKATPFTTYRQLYDAVWQQMQSVRRAHQPEIIGFADRLLFGGAAAAQIISLPPTPLSIELLKVVKNQWGIPQVGGAATGFSVADEFVIRLTNHSGQGLYCQVATVSAQGHVSVVAPLDQGRLQMIRREELYLPPGAVRVFPANGGSLQFQSSNTGCETFAAFAFPLPIRPFFENKNIAASSTRAPTLLAASWWEKWLKEDPKAALPKGMLVSKIVAEIKK